ncbi:MAG: DUF3017 domain-containing protein [Catenulisporales bacterium]|nr:DUF3017 domain-containing protein [Catenulisporales bacterium]
MAVNNRPAGDSFGRKVLAEWPILLVLAVFGFGMTVILHDEVFQGAAILGLSILLAAGLRLFLPTRVAGTLAIRRRGIDVGMYTVLGTALVILGLLVQGIFSS